METAEARAAVGRCATAAGGGRYETLSRVHTARKKKKTPGRSYLMARAHGPGALLNGACSEIAHCA